VRITHTLVLICALAAAAFAGDYAKLEVIGFSQEGRYLAFEEYGTQDGSGFPYSSIFFIDTAKNSFAVPPIKVRIEKEAASEGQARRQAANLAAKSLAAYRIVRGNTGNLVLSHLPTDLTFDDEDKQVRFAEEIGSMYHKGDYALKLNEIPLKTPECQSYGDETFGLELTLSDKEGNATRTLQKDVALPASRGCALSYDIRSVYIYKGLIAAFVSVYTRGFEGPDLRHLAVTGKLK